jgi:4-amino-4-deoxy-L-arabinose transferase-like glycosyltransferase
MGTSVAEPVVISSHSAQSQSAAVCIPEQLRSERFIALAIFLLSFLYLCLFRRYSWIDPDEGIILQGAQRILDGQVLYRDFFSFLTPGSYYFNALLFRLFGNSFLVARTAVALIGASFAPITYLLARRVCSLGMSVGIAGLMTLTTLPFRFMVLHNWDSTLLALLALYCGVRWLECRTWIWAFAAGSFVSLTGAFEQSKGAGLALGLGISFFLIIVVGRQHGRFGRSLLAAVAGLTWPVALVLIYFAKQHALGPMIADLVWPFTHYSVANRVPYGYQNLSEDARHTIFFSGSWGIRLAKILAFSPSIWIPILPLFGVALLPRLITRVWRRRFLTETDSYYLVVSGSFAGLLACSVVLVRPDIVHFVYLQPIFFLVLAWLLDGRHVRTRRIENAGPTLSVVVALSLVLMGAVLLLRTSAATSSLTTRRGLVRTSVNTNVIESIQNYASPGEHILAYPYSSMLYYLTGTYSATALDYFQPGMHTGVQAADFLSQLEAHPVRLVVYEPQFGDQIRVSWPNTPASALANDPVSDYIMREYRPCKSLDSAASHKSAGESRFLFMIRKDLSCP